MAQELVSMAQELLPLRLNQIIALDWVGHEALTREQKRAAREYAREILSGTLAQGLDVVHQGFRGTHIGFTCEGVQVVGSALYTVKFLYVRPLRIADV